MDDQKLLFRHEGLCQVWSMSPGYKEPIREPTGELPKPVIERVNGAMIVTSSDNDPHVQFCRSVKIYLKGQYAQHPCHIEIRKVRKGERTTYTSTYTPTWLNASVVMKDGVILHDTRTVFPMFSCLDAARAARKITDSLEEQLEDGEIDLDTYLQKSRNWVNKFNKRFADPSVLRAFQKKESDRHNREWVAEREEDLQRLRAKLKTVVDTEIYSEYEDDPVVVVKRTPKRVYVTTKYECGTFIIPLDKLHQEGSVRAKDTRFYLGTNRRDYITTQIKQTEEALERQSLRHQAKEEA